MESLRKLAWKYIPHSLISIYKLIFHPDSFIRKTKYIKTVYKNKPFDNKGEALPWLSYGAIKFLEERINKKMTLFEYGSGFSTIYFKSRLKFVTSVEHHLGWYDNVSASINGNISILYRPLSGIAGEYCEAISEGNQKYDLVLIDGRERAKCCLAAIKHLSNNGIIILDDGEREQYREIYITLVESGFKYIKFYGLRPASCYFDSTVIFYKSGNNVLDI